MSAGADRLRTARRVVVKVGSALLVDASTGRLNREWLTALADDLSGLRREGQELVVVSSGAIALGRGPLELAAGRLVAVKIPELSAQRHVRLVFRRGAQLSHAAEAFLATVRQLAPPSEKESCRV